MLSLLATVLLSALPAMPSASVTCAEGPASCDASWVLSAGDRPAAPAAPREVATPAEVDCPAPHAAEGADGPGALAGECHGVTLDFWYRASRLADGPLDDGGGLAPDGRAPRGADADRASSCGVPRPAVELPPTHAQPVALFALPGLMLEAVSSRLDPDTRQLPARVLAPPDRPPRG